MKGFKTKQQMMEGHYCWGGKAMKKAKGGYAEGGMRSESTEDERESRQSMSRDNPMRSESTQAALARRKTRDTAVDAISAEADDITAHATGRSKSEKNAAQQAMKDAITKRDDAIAADKLTQKQTGYSSKGDQYSRYLGYKTGGKVIKKAEGGSIRSQFNDAFGEARKRGDKTFEFRGKLYGTELAKPKPKVEVGPHGPGDESFTPDQPKAGSRMKNVAEEVNDYKSGSANPSMEEDSSNRGMRVKTSGEDIADLLRLMPTPSANPPEFTRKEYGMPGVRMGKKGEPAIVIGSGEDESPKPVKSNYNYGKSRTKDEQDLADIVQKKRGGWIAEATKNKGALHRALGVPQGEKIPAAKLNKAAHSSNPKMAKRAQLAKTLKSFNKG
jgi:hypothetical protein